jgi:DNA replication protein DnaC
VGKTHLAVSLAIKTCSHGFKVYFTTMNPLIGKLKETQSKGKAYLSASLVIVDEAGYLPVDNREAYLFFQFISYRYEKRSTIITSNKSFSDWQELFGMP